MCHTTHDAEHGRAGKWEGHPREEERDIETGREEEVSKRQEWKRSKRGSEEEERKSRWVCPFMDSWGGTGLVADRL